METEKVIPIEIWDLEDNEYFFTPVSKKGTTKRTAISVEQYNEDRDLQLSIMGSFGKPTATKSQNFINLDDYYDDDDLHVLNFVPQNTSFGKRKKPFSSPSMTEKGQSSNSKKTKHIHEDPSFVCEICVETKSSQESFNVKGCSHAYCTDCVNKYVVSKLQQSITSIRCPVPDCGGLLEPEYCRNILPREVFDRWGAVLCEAVIVGAQKFYCPFNDCSALLIDDRGKVIRKSECPNCKRSFCVQCKVPWHKGIECAKFQKLHKTDGETADDLLMKLAQRKKWKRCPECRYYVEKRDGCNHMRCRCGMDFCYQCGAPFGFSGVHNCR